MFTRTSGTPNIVATPAGAAASDTAAHGDGATVAGATLGTVREGIPRTTRRNNDVSHREQAMEMREAGSDGEWTLVEPGDPAARIRTLEAENAGLKQQVTELLAALRAVTGAAAPDTSSRDKTLTDATVATSTMEDSPPSEDSRIYTYPGHSAPADFTENFRAEHPVTVYTGSEVEWDEVIRIPELNNLLFFKSSSSSLTEPECLLRMMIGNGMDDDQAIHAMFRERGDPSLRPNPKKLIEWLEKGTRYGTAKLMYRIYNHDVTYAPARAANRAAEKQMLFDMEEAKKAGKFACFLFVRGIRAKTYMLVVDVNAREGTATYIELPSAICATGAPFRRQRNVTGEMDDKFEDWLLFGLNPPKTASASKA